MNTEVKARPSPGAQLVRWPGVKGVLGFCWSRQHVINMTRKGTFPAPYRLSANTVAWDVDELLEWKASRERAVPAPKPEDKRAEPPPMRGHRSGPALDHSHGAPRRRVLIEEDNDEDADDDHRPSGRARRRVAPAG